MEAIPGRARRRWIAAAILVLLFLALGAFGAGSQAPGLMRVSFIDVGQGDSALLSDANGFDVLIDGGKQSAGPTVVAFLRQQGVDDIDVLVVSHADNDHYGGLIKVLEATDIVVEAVVYNGYPSTAVSWGAFLSAAAARGLTPTAAQFPATFSWGEMDAHVLNPPTGLSTTDDNALSLVLRIDHGEMNFLFTGDLESASEAQVIARGTPVAAEVLKVAHHGSAYASSAYFLQAVSPWESIISVGENNYGHPAADTLARLASAGAHIWRTDRNGTVLVTSDGFSITVVPQRVPRDFFLPVIVKGP